MSDTLVSIRDLSIDLATDDGPAHVLRGVSADLGRGRIVGLVGESGSGKSTLALALLGLLPADLMRLDGNILYDGRDLIALPQPEMRRLRGRRFAMIFQDPMSALNPVFRIGTQLVDLQRARRPRARPGERRARAAEMLARVGLDGVGRLDTFPHELSGGMRQRVMIAAALLAEPDLLIADEPTTALDPTVEAGIVRLLGDLRRDFSGTILFISHSLALVSELSDDVIVLYGGTVMERAPAAALFRRPLHPYTKALIACEIDADVQRGTRLSSIPGAPFAVTRPVEGCIFAERCPHVRDACRAAQPALRTIAPGHDAACIRAEEIADE